MKLGESKLKLLDAMHALDIRAASYNINRIPICGFFIIDKNKIKFYANIIYANIF